MQSNDAGWAWGNRFVSWYIALWVVFPLLIEDVFCSRGPFLLRYSFLVYRSERSEETSGLLHRLELRHNSLPADFVIYCDSILQTGDYLRPLAWTRYWA